MPYSQSRPIRRVDGHYRSFRHGLRTVPHGSVSTMSERSPFNGVHTPVENFVEVERRGVRKGCTVEVRLQEKALPMGAGRVSGFNEHGLVLVAGLKNPASPFMCYRIGVVMPKIGSWVKVGIGDIRAIVNHNDRKNRCSKLHLADRRPVKLGDEEWISWDLMTQIPTR